LALSNLDSGPQEGLHVWLLSANTDLALDVGFKERLCHSEATSICVFVSFVLVASLGFGDCCGNRL
jgi:uncharacterized Tic20 family protein